MEKYYETKVGKIIKSEFDLRLTNMVVGYILDKGWGNIIDITDEMISNEDGNAIMSKECVQELIRCSREICRTCSMWEDFLPFVRCHIGINNYQMKEVKFEKEDYSDDDWDYLTCQMEADESSDRIECLVCVMDEIVYE